MRFEVGKGMDVVIAYLGCLDQWIVESDHVILWYICLFGFYCEYLGLI